MGLALLGAEIILVATGLLDWRTAVVVIAVVEGALACLGLIAGATLLSRYRKLRTDGRRRSAALSGAFFYLFPPPIANAVRIEFSVVKIIFLGLIGRREGMRLGDEMVPYGKVAVRALLTVSATLVLGGVAVLAFISQSVVRYVAGGLLIYLSILTGAVGLAGKVRPHLLNRQHLIIRWGVHQEVCVSLSEIVDARGEEGDIRLSRSHASGEFVVPGVGGRPHVVLQLANDVDFPVRRGRTLRARVIRLPVDEAATTVRDIMRMKEEVS
ncbi:hypothetical protein [Microbispora hainanensis]|uniref:Uncharacterized protein n=1 Tax=Microbispora hainanensis TaxID=568844 RepID=A0ABZ1SIJ6_9ACTN|nr:hypothetical protein [Microbispora hainanensis]